MHPPALSVFFPPMDQGKNKSITNRLLSSYIRVKLKDNFIGRGHYLRKLNTVLNIGNKRTPFQTFHFPSGLCHFLENDNPYKFTTYLTENTASEKKNSLFFW